MEEEINCFYCQKMISVNAKKCPYCQEWVPKNYIKNKNSDGNFKKVSLIKKIILLIIFISTWYISIPIFIIYFYYNQNKFNNNYFWSTFLKNKKRLIIPILFIYSIIVIPISISNAFKIDSKHTKESYTESTPAPIPTDKVYNSPWDGSVYEVKNYLEKTLKDPNSYQSIEWSNVLKGKEGFSVRHKFRAKNSFGGYEIEEYIFSLDKEGNIIGSVKL